MVLKNDISAKRALSPNSREREFSFMRYGQMPPIQPTSWLVKPYFEKNSLGELVGPSDSCKSFFAVNVACCVATGREWYGHRVRQGGVFYIAGEGQNNIQKRFRAWELHHGMALGDAPLFISNHAVQLLSAGEAERVSAIIEALAESSKVKPELIVIDTLARNFGGDENSTEDMSQFIHAVDSALRHRFGACVLVIHHTGHGDQSRGRGSSALKGGVDAEYQLLRGEGDVIRCTPRKMKDAALPAPIAFRPCVVDLGLVDEDNDFVTSLVLQPADYTVESEISSGPSGKLQQTFLQVLKELEIASNGSGVAETDLRPRLAEQGLHRNRWPEVKKSLLNGGFIRVLPDGSIQSS